MEIIYKENGKVDIEKSIQGELEGLKDFDKTLEKSYRKPIKEIQAAIKGLEKSDLPIVTDELYALMDNLGEGSRGKIYHKTYELDENGEQIERSGEYKDLFALRKCILDYYKREGIVSWDQLDPYYREKPNRHDVATIALALTGWDKMEWYVSKIEDAEGNVLYTNHIEPNSSVIEICEKSIKRFGKIAGIGFLKEKIDELEFPLHQGEYIIKKSKEMLGKVTGLIEKCLKCVYPQRKEELIECLLNNATGPDVGEDSFDIQTTYKIAVQALQMIKDKSSAKEVCEYIDKARGRHFIHEVDIYSFLAKYGKETGIQIFEEKVLNPALAKSKNEKISYLDYVVAEIQNAQKFISNIKADNDRYEKEMKVNPSTKIKNK